MSSTGGILVLALICPRYYCLREYLKKGYQLVTHVNKCNLMTHHGTRRSFVYVICYEWLA